jgi:ribosomal protein S18 acetylase RimI-like enzyme
VSDGIEAGDDAAARVDGGEVSIDIATEIDEAVVDAMARLVPQLSRSSAPPDREALEEIVADPNSVLFLARLGGVVVGTLTLALYRIPTGLKAWIEDVVVDAGATRHGIGAALNRAALEEARRRGARAVDLTSRPDREAANRLYVRLGFQRRTTNVYRHALES